MRNMKPVTLQVQSGQIGKITIHTDEMETAGDIIQDLCQSMNISDIQSSCEFK